MSIALEPTGRRAAAPAARAPAVAIASTTPWHAYSAVFAAACVMIGVYWDISWHMSIGRDTFWTPAHLVIQAGGLIAGLGSGFAVLRTTFRGTAAERDASVGFWGFRGPLGAWICIWGSGAMLASAPFDNWWHNAYGLDVKIVSPPHVILAVGIFAIVTGALLLTLAQQNRATGDDRRRYAWLLAATAGFFIMNFALFLTEYTERRMMHSAFFYQLMAATFPMALASMARAIKLRWAATAAAAFFTGMMLVLMWTIELFPATPKLGPIYQHLTHMVTPSFPVLVIAPAVFIDLILHRFDGKLGTVALGTLVGVTFVATFVAVQWPFADFLVHSQLARGPIFNGDNFVYWMQPAYEQMTRRFDPRGKGDWPMSIELLIAAGLASLASMLGLSRGAWMARVRR